MERLKIVLLGSICVGKTSIIDQYIRNGFYELFEKTIVADKSIKEIVLSDGKKTDLEIWDTPGSEIYISVSKHCLKNAKIVLLIYDITDKRSFEELNYFYNDICEMNEKENIFFVLLQINVIYMKIKLFHLNLEKNMQIQLMLYFLKQVLLTMKI